MPYITQEARDRLIDPIRAYESPETAGELNFMITLVCKAFLSETEGKYADYNTIIGALESAKLEFYRRAVATYEDTKIRDNGDVY